MQNENQQVEMKEFNDWSQTVIDNSDGTRDIEDVIDYMYPNNPYTTALDSSCFDLYIKALYQDEQLVIKAYHEFKTIYDISALSHKELINGIVEHMVKIRCLELAGKS